MSLNSIFTLVEHRSETKVRLAGTESVFNGRDVRTVAREDFIGQGKALGGNYQSDADLFAVRSVVATVSALRLRAAFALAFKVGAGYVIEKELEAGTEHADSIDQMNASTQSTVLHYMALQENTARYY
jgi:hypothetical protein